jgi:UDP-glucose 4-epimerase
VRALVTGATTPLGAAVVRELVDAGAEHVLAVGADDEPAALASSRAVAYLGVDLTRSRAVHDLLWGPARRAGIDVVVHGALHRSARDRGPRVHVQNVEVTRRLLAACDRHPTVRRLVVRSAAEVYALRTAEPNLVDEDTPLELDPAAPQWVRDRVEADLTACAHMGLSSVAIVVVRCAEVLAPGTGSQLWDYLQSRVCLRPLGFDPMINVLSAADAARAIRLAAAGDGQGVFNVPGADTLPLSRIIARWGRRDVQVPGPLLAPLYRLRARSVGFEFRYDLNLRRFHFGGVVDGTRARRELGYQPRHPIVWPRSDRPAPRPTVTPPPPRGADLARSGPHG